MKFSKPRLLFVYYSKHPVEVQDGLWAALELLKKDFDIKKMNLASKREFYEPDFVLAWGAWSSPADKQARQFKCPKGLCIGGNTFPPDKSDEYDVLFYETKWYQPQIKHHKNIVHAFGVNTDVYQEIEPPTKRDIDYLGVGAFALWKRWEKMGDKIGHRLVVGEYQEDNEEESGEIWDALCEKGVHCMKMVSSRKLNVLYNRAKTVYLPAEVIGGGERAVLEARAAGCKVEVEPYNPKLGELLDCELYDQHYYYKQLKRGIESCLKG